MSGSVHFICMDWRHLGELIAAGRQVYESLLNVCVWVKNNGGMGSFYRSRHELVLVFRKDKGKHRNNVQLGRYGRNRTNVWEYPTINTLSKNGDEGNLLALHPTVKPVHWWPMRCSIAHPAGTWLSTHFGLGIDPNRRRADRAVLWRHRTRSNICRHCDSTLAALHRRPCQRYVERKTI